MCQKVILCLLMQGLLFWKDLGNKRGKVDPLSFVSHIFPPDHGHNGPRGSMALAQGCLLKEVADQAVS
jgi:hypothetical protein